MGYLLHNIIIYIGAIVAIILIPILWVLLLKWYLNFAVSFYETKGIYPISSINQNSTNKERLMKLFFYRQQTYEFSGYALLVLAIFILFCCVFVFVFANKIVQNTTDNANLTEQIFWISSISLRIGISVVVFFICQLLLKLYRHCVKRALFYMGLFDVMMMSKDFDQLDTETLLKVLSPNIDIDKEPETPINADLMSKSIK